MISSCINSGPIRLLMKPKSEHFLQHNYQNEAVMAQDFLKNFISQSYKGPYREHGKKKYVQEIQKIRDKKSATLEIHLEDLEEFFGEGGEKEKNFLKAIYYNTKRYIQIFQDVANQNMDEIKRKSPMTEEEEFDEALENCRMEYLNKNEKMDNKIEYDKIKKILTNQFSVVIVPGPNSKKTRTKMRDLKSAQIGSMVHIRAVVMRVTEVQPLIDVACYICENC